MHFTWYDISADGGETWTTQYLTESEAKDERAQGHIVLQRKYPLKAAAER